MITVNTLESKNALIRLFNHLATLTDDVKTQNLLSVLQGNIQVVPYRGMEIDYIPPNKTKKDKYIIIETSATKSKNLIQKIIGFVLQRKQ